MPRRKKPEKTLAEKLLMLKKAGINEKRNSGQTPADDQLLPLGERIRKILGIFRKTESKTNRMLYFIMYDIENNKVRTAIAKYLEKQGCIRVQKSIFIADTERQKFDEMHNTLKEVQSFYDNNDSIFFVPVSSDEIRAMKIIGQSIDFNFFLSNPSTIFF